MAYCNNISKIMAINTGDNNYLSLLTRGGSLGEWLGLWT